MSKNQRVRLTPDMRHSQILDAAVKIALEKGIYNFGIVNVARSIANCSKPTVRHYFSNITELRTAVIEAAIERGHGRLVAQAITMDDPCVRHLSKSERKKYLTNVQL